MKLFTEQTIFTLCLDDLQWADTASLDFLSTIAAECTSNLLIVRVYAASTN